MLRDLPDGYDLDHLRSALDYLSDFRLAIDGGAHRGIWTAEMAQRFDVVVAFEPRPEFAKQISGLPNVSVFEVALGDGFGACGMMDGDKNNGQAHVVSGMTHPVRPLDWYHFDEVDLLKLDLEGYELMALNGAIETIESCQPAILLEQNGLCERYGYTADHLSRWLEARGYEHVAEFGVDNLWMAREHRRRLQH